MEGFSLPFRHVAGDFALARSISRKKNEEFRVLSTLRSPMCASVRDSSRALEIRYDTFI